MRLRWERVSRIPRPPLWAVVLVGLWLLLVLGGILLERWGAPAQETCLLHRMTGHPCPTCGSTRVARALGNGDWSGAFRLNPLVAAGAILGGLWLLTRVATGMRPVPELSLRERGAALAVGVMVLVANWVWVLQVQD